jgi:hypothetical protein
MAALAVAVGQREQEPGDHKHHVQADIPADVAVRGVFQVHEHLEELDRRDRHDRRHQLQLEAGEVDLGHPFRPIRVLIDVDL